MFIVAKIRYPSPAAKSSCDVECDCLGRWYANGFWVDTIQPSRSMLGQARRYSFLVWDLLPANTALGTVSRTSILSGHG